VENRVKRVGFGVSQNDVEAARWYRKAAEQGVPTAQRALGMLYAEGRGLPQDYVLAHMWANLAASTGNETARENRDNIADRMTPEQIAEAQRLACAWQPTSNK
jgi:TPR repeat protein